MGGTLAVLIDAKSGETWRITGNLDIEKAALAAAVRFSLALKIEVYFIFSDGSAISAVQLDHCVKWEVSWRGRGSGTPFWLFHKAYYNTNINNYTNTTQKIHLHLDKYITITIK